MVSSPRRAAANYFIYKLFIPQAVCPGTPASRGNQRRSNRVNARAAIYLDIAFWAGNNQHMFVTAGAVLNVVDFFVKVPFHAAAYRRVELSDVADFHPASVIPSEVEESLTISDCWQL